MGLTKTADEPGFTYVLFALKGGVRFPGRVRDARTENLPGGQVSARSFCIIWLRIYLSGKEMDRVRPLDTLIRQFSSQHYPAG